MRSQRPSGAAGPTLASRAATSRCSVTSARQRGQSAQVGLDRVALVGVDRVEGVGAEQLRISSWLSSRHCDLPAGVGQLAAQPAQPGADPALHRAFRLVEQRGHLAVGVAAEVGQLDGLRARRRAGSTSASFTELGHHHVPHLVLDVVAGLGRPPEVLLPHGAGATTPTAAGRPSGRGTGRAGTTAASPARGRTSRGGSRGAGRPPARSPRPASGRRAGAGPGRRRRRRGGGRPRPAPPGGTG